MTRAYDTAGLLELFARELGKSDSGAGVAFDADGTLWSGDVGDDVFFYALERDFLRPEARRALQEVAAQHGLATTGSLDALARRIYDAHLDGEVPQPITYAMMAWCFAGRTERELTELVREALAATRIEGRLRRELEPILRWARTNQLRTLVISASPQVAVEVAAAHWGFEPQDIVGVACATNNEGCILPEVAGPVPYGEEKTRLGQQLLDGARWLAAFGDNAFDADMLNAAEFGVAVAPKDALRERLGELKGVVELVA